MDQTTDYFRHSAAIVESPHIGAGTRIWAFAHVLPRARIGRDCNVCDGVFIENDVVVGDRVTIKCGVQLWDGVRLEDDVFVGPNATFTNDPFPRSRQHPESFPQTLVRSGASIGANATILPGLVIGAGAMVGAGAVVTKDVPPFAIVTGNPGRVVGFVDAKSPGDDRGSQAGRSASRPLLRVPEVALHSLPAVEDHRGKLSFAQYEDQLPFRVQRYFVIYDVPNKEIRGEHAHKALHQFLICVAGECRVVVDNGTEREEVVLASPTTGLHVPPMIWASQYSYSEDAVLLVLASDRYVESDYIRNYDDYLAAARGRT